MQTYNFVV